MPYYNYNMLNSIPFLLLLSYDLLEDRCIDDVIIGNFVSLLHKTNRFHVAMLVFSKRPQETSKCGKKIRGTHSAVTSCATFLFLPQFDVICDLSLHIVTAHNFMHH